MCIGTEVENTVPSHKHATLTYSHRHSYISFLPFFFIFVRKKLLGLWQRLYLGAAVLFQCSDVSPAVFIKSFCQAGNPALLHYSYIGYRDGGIGSPDHHFDDMQRRRGRLSASLASAVTGAFPAAVIIKLNTGARNEISLHLEGTLTWAW